MSRLNTLTALGLAGTIAVATVHALAELGAAVFRRVIDEDPGPLGQREP